MPIDACECLNVELRGLVAIASFENATKANNSPRETQARSAHMNPSDDENPFAYLNRFLKRTQVDNTLIARSRTRRRRPSSSLDALPMVLTFNRGTMKGSSRDMHLQPTHAQTYSPLPKVSQKIASSLDSLPVIQNSVNHVRTRDVPDPICLTSSSPVTVASVSRPSSDDMTIRTSKRKLFCTDNKPKTSLSQHSDIVCLGTNMNSNTIDLSYGRSRGVNHRCSKKRIISLVDNSSPEIQKNKKQKLFVDLEKSTCTTSSTTSIFSECSRTQRSGVARLNSIAYNTSSTQKSSSENLSHNLFPVLSMRKSESSRQYDHANIVDVQDLTMEQLNCVNQMSHDLLESRSTQKAPIQPRKIENGPLNRLLAVSKARRHPSNVIPRKTSKQQKLTDCGFFSPGDKSSQTR